MIMKLSIYKACISMVHLGFASQGDWKIFVSEKTRNDCVNIQTIYNVKNKNGSCDDCEKKIVDIKELGIKPEMMKEFMFWLIKKWGNK